MDCINECHQVIRHESEKPCKIDVHFTLGVSTKVTTMRLAAVTLLACLAGCTNSKPDKARLIQAAIQFSYPSIYGDLSDLRKDYPAFTPSIRRWSDDLIFLFSEGLYAVQMPEEEVLVTADGKAKTTRRCGGTEAECVLVAPSSPELGVVGTVQLESPGYPIAQGLEVAWKGTPGYVHVVGNCFSAFKSSAEPLVLSLKVPGYKPLEISGVYGTRLIAATLDNTGGHYYGSGRIPKAMFLESKSCSESVRAKWPNVGGWAWKR